MNYDAFSSSQFLSKHWLVQTLERTLHTNANLDQSYKIYLLAGWYGITNLILRTRDKIKIETVKSYDIDPECADIAEKINETWVWMNWQFKAYTQDINLLTYDNDQPDIVINTSLEHLDDNTWFELIPSGTIVALQGCNLHHEDHNNVFSNIEQLKEKYNLQEYWFEGLKMFQYDDDSFQRFMIIGVK
jgi:hypothetical protein